MVVRRALLFVVILLVVGCADAVRDPRPAPNAIRVLFIGNSLTYTNNLPRMLQSFSVAEPRPLRCESVTFPAASLAFHHLTQAAEHKIRSHGWDYVVLQDYSTRALDNPNATISSLRQFAPAIAYAHANPLLFENWQRRDRPNSFATLHENYLRISADTSIPLVPIGEAWQHASQQLSWFRPFMDERHPRTMGTYLAGCVLFEVIYHHPAPESPVPRSLTPVEAAALRNIATTTISR